MCSQLEFPWRSVAEPQADQYHADHSAAAPLLLYFENAHKLRGRSEAVPATLPNVCSHSPQSRLHPKSKAQPVFGWVQQKNPGGWRHPLTRQAADAEPPERPPSQGHP